jgi:hypothetical protein
MAHLASGGAQLPPASCSATRGLPTQRTATQDGKVTAAVVTTVAHERRELSRRMLPNPIAVPTRAGVQ